MSRQVAVIEEVRKALSIALDVGEQFGKTLTKDRA